MTQEDKSLLMKTPDKIYVDYGLIDYHCLDEQKVDGIEYIRKGAILEWANEQEKELEYGISADAYKLALDMLREKLNSL